MNLVNILIGFAVLLFGRQLFWVFVGGVGFVLGVTLGGQLLATGPDWQVFVIGLVVGVLGAFCAVVFERMAVGAAGFLAGCAIAMQVMDIMALHPAHLIWSLLWLGGGVLGAVVVAALFDWALIVLSSAVGAFLVTDSIVMSPVNARVLSAVLLGVGIIVQAGRWKRSARTSDRR
jgi:hypothetical protein